MLPFNRADTGFFPERHSLWHLQQEVEEKREDFYRCEREYGSFSRAVPLPEGVKLEDVKATFSDGVLEVSVPVPARPEAKMRKVEIQEPAKAAKSTA